MVAHISPGLILLLLAALAAPAQLPRSSALSPQDQRLFNAEVARTEKLMSTAADKPAGTYQVARTWAAAKQWPETIEWLRKVVAFEAGLDPSRDSIFAALRGTSEFEAILEAVQASTPPVSHSSVSFKVQQGDLVPESMAFHPAGERFYFGSMRKGEVLECTTAGNCRQFVAGLGTVLGMKVNGSSLWLLNNENNASHLMRYDLASRRLVNKFSISGPGHNFNDLVFSPGADVYVTDTRAAAVWRLATKGMNLTRLPQRFEFANGIAISPDSRFLYVSTFPDGLTLLDLKTGRTAPISRPADLCLASIDGLYFHERLLIAIQNGSMNPRVIRLVLSRDLRAIEKYDILERRNPLFDGVTTGVIANGNFFYMANIQDEKKSGFIPISVLKIHL